MKDTRTQAIAIVAAIFAARELAHFKDVSDRRAKFAIDAAISKAQRLVELIERKLRP